MKRNCIHARATHCSIAVLVGSLLICTQIASGACDMTPMDSATSGVGCDRGNWTVLCHQDGTNCQVSVGYCWEINTDSGYCGDICVYDPGSGTDCGDQQEIDLPVTGTYGTPSCDSNCNGICVDITPYPEGTTYPYVTLDAVPCGG